MTRTDLIIVSYCFGFLLAMIFTSIFKYLRKGGIRELRNELDVEVDLNVGLLNHIEDIEFALKNERETSEGLRERLSNAGAGMESEPLSANDLSAARSSSLWDCEERGHDFVMENTNGELTRRCTHCWYNGGSAA